MSGLVMVIGAAFGIWRGWVGGGDLWDGFGEVAALCGAFVLEDDLVDVGVGAEVLVGDEAFGQGAGEFSEEAATLGGGGWGVVGGSEFAGEIGGAEAAGRGVRVGTAHVNVGFFHGAALANPSRLLQGSGKCMRHVTLRPGTVVNAEALRALIEAAYTDIKERVENGLSGK